MMFPMTPMIHFGLRGEKNKIIKCFDPFTLPLCSPPLFYFNLTQSIPKVIPHP